MAIINQVAAAHFMRDSQHPPVAYASGCTVEYAAGVFTMTLLDDEEISQFDLVAYGVQHFGPAAYIVVSTTADPSIFEARARDPETGVVLTDVMFSVVLSRLVDPVAY